MRVRLATVAALAAGGALLWLERRRPLRRCIEPATRHDLRNLAIAGLAAATVRLVERPVVEPLAALIARRRWGALPALGLPRAAERLLALALLDYTLYLWHILTHRLPLLWRLHRVHHADLDLTATTALRFHAMELALCAVACRAGGRDRRQRIDAPALAAGDVRFDSLSPFESAPAERSRSLPCRDPDDAAASRHPPLVAAGRDEHQLVERPDLVGQAAPHATAGRAAGGDRHWRSRRAAGGGPRPSPAADAAFAVMESAPPR